MQTISSPGDNERTTVAAKRIVNAVKLGPNVTPERSPPSSVATLGIAGAIYKRRWEVDAKRADLESALRCYQWGYERALARVADGHEGDPWYPAINAAFVCDQLASLEEGALGTPEQAVRLRDRADRIRQEIIAGAPSGPWADATLGEAHFGLRQFTDARRHFGQYNRNTPQLWRRETTALQVAALARLRRLDCDETDTILQALVGATAGGLTRAHIGKVGLALSGGGFRASLFHIGVLARLAECDVLRHVEVLSCVSGGSIVGAYYYLKLRLLLQGKSDAEITRDDYVALVDELARGVSRAASSGNLRGRLRAEPSVKLAR